MNILGVKTYLEQLHLRFVTSAKHLITLLSYVKLHQIRHFFRFQSPRKKIYMLTLFIVRSLTFMLLIVTKLFQVPTCFLRWTKPIGSGVILASKSCSTKQLPIIFSKIFKIIYKHVETFHHKNWFYSSFK